jgi:hypothetical protein
MAVIDVSDVEDPEHRYLEAGVHRPRLRKSTASSAS